VSNYPGVANAAVPAYPNPANLPRGLAQGDSIFLFGLQSAADKSIPISEMNVVGETPTPPQASIACCMGPVAGINGPQPAISVEIRFSGAPGAFNVQVQEADTDADAFYITPSNLAYTMTVVTAQNIARADLTTGAGKFIRILLSSRTNAVSMTAKVTRVA
jgi:hypothetical protein